MAKKKSKGGTPPASSPMDITQELQPIAEVEVPRGTPPAAPPVRVWPLVLIVLLCLTGLGISVYMTHHHEVSVYGGEQVELFGCVESEFVSCDVVNTSEWAELLGVPQFTWGAIGYLLMGGLAVAGALKQRGALPALLALGVGAFGYSIFLGVISVVELKHICMWCSRLYAINLAIPIFALVARAHRQALPDARFFGAFGLAAALVFGLSVGAQRSFRATLLEGAPVLSAPLPDEAATAEHVVAKDPAGQISARTFTIKTEDNNDAELSIGPLDAWKGNPDAKVVIVEFADFECGYCKRSSGQLKRLVEAYQDRVLFVFKHFPMDPKCNVGVNNLKHRDACLAAEASVCAQQQGYFWGFHDLAFKNQHNLDAEDLLTYATKAGANGDAFKACMASGEAQNKVFEDGNLGKRLDIHGTPRIYIDGNLYRSGSSAEIMARAIEVALGAAPQDAAAAAATMREQTLTTTAIPDDVPTVRQLAYGQQRFSIDTFEASLEAGKATVGKHQIPATNMSWFAAKDACEAAGKRMCSEAEWITACQGAEAVDDDGDGAFADDLIEGTTYPYSDIHEPGACWDDKDRAQFRPVYTGEMPACGSKDGVYDLTGNMEEWVGLTPETAVLLGGAFDTDTDHARCYRRNDTFGPGYANVRTGFRCCGK